MLLGMPKTLYSNALFKNQEVLKSLKFYPKILTQGMIMDSFTMLDYVFEYECNLSLIATLSSGILGYSELLFIPLLGRLR